MSSSGMFARLYSRLAILILVGLLPALAALGYTTYQRVQHERASAVEALRNLADVLAAENGLIVGQSQHLLSLLARTSSIRNFLQDSDRCSANLAALKNMESRYAFVGVVDAEGSLRCSALPGIAGINVADRSWFQRVKATGDFAVGDYAVGRRSGRPSLHLAYPIKSDDGTFLGAVDAALDLEWLSGQLATVPLPPELQVVLLDQAGQVLAGRPRAALETIGGLDPSIFTAEPGRGAVVSAGMMLAGKPAVFGHALLGGLQGGTVSVWVGQTEESIGAAARTDLWFDIAALVCIALLGWLVASVAGHFLIALPIGLLEAALSRVAEGDFSAEVSPPFRGGVIAKLSQAFNRMARQLRQREAERDAALAANNAKSHFIADMSHELRTPLNAIIGFSELMLSGVYAEVVIAKHREYLNDIRSSAHDLLRLINDILDLARLESGKARVSEERSDLGEIIRDAVVLVRERANNKQLRMDVPYAELPEIMVDPMRWKQVLLNVLTNAIKFTPAGGSVSIDVEEQASGGLEISIQDTGIGMKPEDIPKALERFGRVGKGRRLAEGTGLGLAIVRELVDAHGGSLRIDSQEGRGTTVRIGLPPERVLRTPAVA